MSPPPTQPIPYVRLTRPQVEALYRFPSNDAKGQRVGILGWGAKSGGIGFDVQAVEDSIRRAGLPVPRITVHGTNNAQNPSGELHMDATIVGTFAPGAEINVYLGYKDGGVIAGLIDQAIADGCSVTTCSFGNPLGPWEDHWSAEDHRAIDAALERAAQKGLTTCFASGDSGAEMIAYPAASPWALAVGGTFIPGDADPSQVTPYDQQVWWNWPTKPGPRPWWASGGGVTHFPVPSYQQSLNPESFPVNGQTYHGRATPDVAALAQGNQGDVGTSATSPLWASLIARINAALGRRVGFIHPKIYADGQSSGALHSIISGNNVPPPGLPGYHQLGYTAQPGWDACTGLGTPDGVKLLTLLRAS